MAIPKNSSKEKSKSVTGEKISQENTQKQNLIKPKKDQLTLFSIMFEQIHADYVWVAKLSH